MVPYLAAILVWVACTAATETMPDALTCSAGGSSSQVLLQTGTAGHQSANAALKSLESQSPRTWTGTLSSVSQSTLYWAPGVSSYYTRWNGINGIAYGSNAPPVGVQCSFTTTSQNNLAYIASYTCPASSISFSGFPRETLVPSLGLPKMLYFYSNRNQPVLAAPFGKLYCAGTYNQVSGKQQIGSLSCAQGSPPASGPNSFSGQLTDVMIPFVGAGPSMYFLSQGNKYLAVPVGNLQCTGTYDYSTGGPLIQRLSC